MRTRRNRGNEAPLVLDTTSAKVLDLARYQDHAGAQKFTDWHWGRKPQVAIDWNDADYPEPLVECGRLVELRVRMPGQRRSTRITLADKEGNKSHLAFHADHPNERLYICSAKNVRNDAKVMYWDKGGDVWNLNDLAEAIGGRHGTRDYPDVNVRPIGILTDVIYATHKEGDVEADGAPSFYIHAMGEEGGTQPVLAVDVRGRWWIAGGSYTAPDPGITQ